VTASAFSCGLALGVVLGAALWSVSLWLSRQAVIAAQRREANNSRQQILAQQKRIEKAKEQLRMQYGHEMTAEQERIMESELGKVFKEFPNPHVPRDT
jgi:hypothetical protein